MNRLPAWNWWWSRFGRKEGPLFLLDLGRPVGVESGRRSERLVFRERFGTLLRRQFRSWKLVELSAEANLEFSLSPAFPRAFLRYGQHGWAAISCPPVGDEGAALSFGLIWLSYLRGRERRVAVNGLAIYVSAGREQAAALRLLCLDPTAANFARFSYTADDQWRRPIPGITGTWTRGWNLAGVSPTMRRAARRGGTFCRFPAWRPFPNPAAPPFACTAWSSPRFPERICCSELANASSARTSSGGNPRRGRAVGVSRSPQATDREHPLYRRFPEAWLESQVRHQLEIVDATLLKEPIYGQVPAFAGGERDVLDLLAVDRTGRLTLLELKASADPHLPMQALDYSIRVKWHLDRGEFTGRGYFPGITLRSDPPRLLLVSPSEFHPSTETLLRYYSPIIEVERVGLGVE